MDVSEVDDCGIRVPAFLLAHLNVQSNTVRPLECNGCC